MGYTTINSSNDVRELAAHLRGTTREVPVVVVSSGKAGPVIDPSAIAAKLTGVAEVYLLEHPAIAFEFEDLMPDDTSVYGGGVRSYPVGTGWMTQAHASMVRLAYTPEEASAAVALVVEDARVMADFSHPGHRELRPKAAAAKHAAVKAAPVSGTITMLLSGGALVKLDTGSPASIDLTSTFPDIDSSRILEPGMKVSGPLDGGTLDITGMLMTAGESVAHFNAGGTYPAMVASPKTVDLFPGLTVRCRTEEPAGSIVAVTVEQQGRADGKDWKLVVAAGTTVSEAPAVVKGGVVPWIVLPARTTHPAAAPDTVEPVKTAPPAPEPMASIIEAAAGPSPVSPEASLAALDIIRRGIEAMIENNAELTGQVSDLSSEIGELTVTAADKTPIPSVLIQGAEVLRLRGHIDRLQGERAEILGDLRRTLDDADGLARELNAARTENQRLRDGVRTEKERASRARSMARANADDEAAESLAFTDPVEQFRHEVYMEWAARIPASSKKELPLCRYDLAPDFLRSVEDLQGVERSKVVAVVVEVLTGLAENMAGREMHRLRNGAAGGSAWVEDRALGTAWRVSLQVRTASARRLHFWRGEAGQITLANVGVHDEALV